MSANAKHNQRVTIRRPWESLKESLSAAVGITGSTFIPNLYLAHAANVDKASLSADSTIMSNIPQDCCVDQAAAVLLANLQLRTLVSLRALRFEIEAAAFKPKT